MYVYQGLGLSVVCGLYVHLHNSGSTLLFNHIWCYFFRQIFCIKSANWLGLL